MIKSIRSCRSISKLAQISTDGISITSFSGAIQDIRTNVSSLSVIIANHGNVLASVQSMISAVLSFLILLMA